MKILETLSFLSQQNLSYTLDKRICLVFHNVTILFVALNYLMITEKAALLYDSLQWGWTLRIKIHILRYITSQEYKYSVSVIGILNK